jgi:hypothetical protein
MYNCWLASSSHLWPLLLLTEDLLEVLLGSLGALAFFLLPISIKLLFLTFSCLIASFSISRCASVVTITSVVTIASLIGSICPAGIATSSATTVSLIVKSATALVSTTTVPSAASVAAASRGTFVSSIAEGATSGRSFVIIHLISLVGSFVSVDVVAFLFIVVMMITAEAAGTLLLLADLLDDLQLI